ncbi:MULTISPECIES: hypothetical protein [Kitasatospora]|uniref:DUF304 domain-containing protein n=1 Tax=Kitasatospora arboriphila TaxID=258052 RepID=A0ABN1TVG5_9ACTN
MELSPSGVNRVANAVLGLVPSIGGLVYAVEAAGGLSRLVAGVVVVGGAVLGVRGYRLGVTCRGGHLTVRGYLWTRVIPRQYVVGITGFPAVRWRPPAGRMRWTPISAFVASRGETSGAAAAKADAVARLRRWAGQ